MFNVDQLGGAMQTLSESLAELSAKAKAAEDAAAAARKEGREKLEARVADLRSSAERRQEQLEQAATEVKESAKSRWNELRSAVKAHNERVASDLEALKQASDEKWAQRRAEWAEQDATAAIGYAVFAIEQAEYAVLGAIIARDEADSTAQV
jgi:chromosome segregation ATPase